jgi:carotenoid cleavage dioxygenase-like enzyme
MQTLLPAYATRDSTMDVEEFQMFYQKNLGPIYRYVYCQVGNREEAEDLTSEIFLKAVSRIDRERSPRSMQFWLYPLRVQRSPTTGEPIIVDQRVHWMNC